VLRYRCGDALASSEDDKGATPRALLVHSCYAHAMPKNRGWAVAIRALAAAASFALSVFCASPRVWAAAETGACCFPTGSCQDDLFAFQCDDAGGNFAGASTSCSMVDCQRSIAAPLFSMAGLVSAIGVAAAFGIRGALARFRRP